MGNGERGTGNGLWNFTTIVPSWVIEGTYSENLKFLNDKTKINGVELLFFIYDDETKELLSKEFLDIQKYKERFLFTAHLPDILNETHEELVEKLLPIVKHFIVHPAKPEDAPHQSVFLQKWFARYGIDKFLIENTHHGCFENLLPLLPSEAGICMDTGHLLLENASPLGHYTKYAPRIKEIHLHGTDAEAAKKDSRLIDHRPLVAPARPPRASDKWLCELLPALQSYNGIINLEVFSFEEVNKSLEVLYEQC
jgi:hypothetical protein